MVLVSTVVPVPSAASSIQIMLAAPVVTLKALLSPVLPPPEVVIVIPVAALVMVTKPVQTPFANGPVVVGLMVPVVSLKVFVSV
ncbi:hypothetical protein ES703_13232 [subsurface metagenome]